MLDALIFRPYPVPRPGEVVTLVSTSRDNGFDDFSYREYLDIRDHTKSYDGVIANVPVASVGFSAGPARRRGSRAECWSPATTFACSASSRRWGAGFREDEDEVPGRDAVAVLGAGLLEAGVARRPVRRRQDIRLNGTDFTVIGVAPETFPGMLIFARPDFYMPLAMAPVVLDRSAEGLLRGPRRPRAERKGALEAGDDARAGAERAGRAGEGLRARVPAAQPRPRRGGAHAVRDADAGRRHQLEVRRDLHDAGAGGAAGGVHQRRGAALEPRAHAHARDRRAAGARAPGASG